MVQPAHIASGLVYANPSPRPWWSRTVSCAHTRRRLDRVASRSFPGAGHAPLRFARESGSAPDSCYPLSCPRFFPDVRGSCCRFLREAAAAPPKCLPLRAALLPVRMSRIGSAIQHCVHSYAPVVKPSTSSPANVPFVDLGPGSPWARPETPLGDRRARRVGIVRNL